VYRSLGMTDAERQRAEYMVSLLPDCYTLELHKCASGEPNKWKHCALFTEFFAVPAGQPDPPDVAYVERNVDALPPCGPRNFMTSGVVLGIAGAALIAGVSIGIIWSPR
jgi:hypothetical protein